MVMQRLQTILCNARLINSTAYRKHSTILARESPAHLSLRLTALIMQKLQATYQIVEPFSSPQLRLD